MGRERRRRLAGRDHEGLDGPALGPADPAKEEDPALPPLAHPRDRRRSRSSTSRRDGAHAGHEDHQRPRAGWTRVRRDAQHHPPARRPLPERRDVAEKRRVVFLGEELASDLFGTEDVVGKTVQINQSPFLVVGVTQKKIRWGCTTGPDRTRPSSRSRPSSRVHGRDRSNLVSAASTRPDDMAGRARSSSTGHGRQVPLRPRGPARSAIWDTREGQQINDNIALGIQIFLGIIGALTLFVGGMGVANIMYAVVKERTREIGVKMALGAKARQVMVPFVLEALVYTSSAGSLGDAVASLIVTGLVAPAPQGRDVRVPGPAHVLARRSPSPPPRCSARSASWPATSPRAAPPPSTPPSSLRYEWRRPCEPHEDGRDADDGAMIEMQAIRKVYDTGRVEVEALKGIDLDDRDGRVRGHRRPLRLRASRR